MASCCGRGGARGSPLRLAPPPPPASLLGVDAPTLRCLSFADSCGRRQRLGGFSCCGFGQVAVANFRCDRRRELSGGTEAQARVATPGRTAPGKPPSWLRGAQRVQARWSRGMWARSPLLAGSPLLTRSLGGHPPPPAQLRARLISVGSPRRFAKFTARAPTGLVTASCMCDSFANLPSLSRPGLSC